MPAPDVAPSPIRPAAPIAHALELTVAPSTARPATTAYRSSPRGPRLSGLAISALLALGFASANAAPSVEDIVSRSDIFVGQPNILPTQAMPLGNGRLGVSVRATDGLTLQLNRSDTLPGRLSPGEVVFDSLKPMIADRQFRARLNLFDGEWRQSGAGLDVRVNIDPQVDRVIVDVTGADPQREQSVSLRLWKPRHPTTLVGATDASLAEHWLDDQNPGASGLSFGSLAGLRVVGREVATRKVDEETVAISFRAMPDGRSRVIIASPSFDGRAAPAALLSATFDPAVDVGAGHRWWHDFWARVCLIEATSPDGNADYFATLRTLFLFYSAAQSRGGLPGSQAGIADLFSASRDAHFWDPAAFWEWNQRMQVAANLTAGLPELNESFFALYRNNLQAIRRWTVAKMGGRGGICIPETMRFNGVGVEYEPAGARPFAVITHSCDLGWPAVANAHTFSTGAEVGLWVWETFQKTGDIRFLRANYPLMAEAARFLLAFQRLGADGLLHTSPSNAHETQSDVLDPTTDIAAIRSLYPATIAAARTLSRDGDLVAALGAALAKTPPLPLIDAPAASDAAARSPNAAAQIIAPSYNPTSPLLNGENIGLEPVWPYSLISANHPLFQTAVRTYEHRPFRDLATWSYDPIHAARLGMGAEMSRSLYSITQLYQIYPNGMADLLGNSGEFYIEQMGIVAAAMAEALVQDHGDSIRIGPAIPPDWTIQGSVFVRGNARIAVTAVNGRVTDFELVAGSTRRFRISSPWVSGELIVIDAKARKSYPFHAPSTGQDAASAQANSAGKGAATSSSNIPVFPAARPTQPKSLGRASIGLGEPCCAPPAGYDPAADRYLTATRESQ